MIFVFIQVAQSIREKPPHAMQSGNKGKKRKDAKPMLMSLQSAVLEVPLLVLSILEHLHSAAHRASFEALEAAAVWYSASSAVLRHGLTCLTEQ